MRSMRARSIMGKPWLETGSWTLDTSLSVTDKQGSKEASPDPPAVVAVSGHLFWRLRGLP